MRAPLKPQQYHILDKELKKLEKLYQRGMTLKEIGKIFGVQENTVSRRLKKLRSAHA